MTLLGEAEAALAGEDGYLDALIALTPQRAGHVADGATWLLKSAFENGERLTVDQTVAYCSAFANLPSWGAQLHACQSVRFLAIPRKQATPVREWIGELQSHKRPFVRAWALDALFHLAQQHDDCLADFERAVAEAQEDDAASVRARARNLK